MPVVGTLACILHLLLSKRYRVWYGALAPKLLRAWMVVLIVLSVAWSTAFAMMALFNRPLLQDGLPFIMAAISVGVLTEIIWLSGPGLAGLYQLRDRIGRLTRIFFVVFGVAFAALTYWAMKLPELHGSQFSVKDLSVRLGAIISGVLFVGCVLSMLVPWVLNRLEATRFANFVAARHVRADKSGFLTAISLLSIMGVALSSCTLSSTTAVMGGFSQDLKRKILGNNAHVVIDVESQVGFADYKEVLAKVRTVPRVMGATAVVNGEVMVSSASNLAGVIVRGIDTDSFPSVIDLPTKIEIGNFQYLVHPEKLNAISPDEVIGRGSHGEQYKKGTFSRLFSDEKPAAEPEIIKPGIIIGRELAKTLHVYIGDDVTLVSPIGDLGPMGIMPRTKKFRIAAVFYTGMYEYDANLVYTRLDDAQVYFDTNGKASVINVKVDDAERVDGVADEIANVLGRTDLRVRDWREINKNLFSALKLEKFAMFLVLTIAMIVASFCIICTLLLMVTEKGKDIAILKALGATNGAILHTFMLEGIIIGAIGTVFGVATGFALCMGVSWFGLRLDPDVYYIDKLPIAVNGWDFLMVAAASLVICTLATIIPAYAASRLRPVDGLHSE